MKIRTKLVLLFLVGGGTAGLGAPIVEHTFSEQAEHALADMAEARHQDVDRRIKLASRAALDQASLFAQHPAVVAALQLAAQGDLTDEADPKGQAAREGLRRDLAPILKSYEGVRGERMQLHVHTSNIRSLARLWRDKQANRDGQWIDVSDDLSSFRETVRQVQATRRPIEGVELGRGGFTIRGLAPVLDERGAVLGSVEVLESFEPVLEVPSGEAHEQMMLFMNAEHLAITTKLKDASKYPMVGERFVQVVGPPQGSLRSAVPPLLAAGAKDLVTDNDGEYLTAAFPVRDYQGRTVGVMVLEKDVSALVASTAAALHNLWMGLGVLAVAVGLVGFVLLERAVVRPARVMSEALNRVAEGGALDLNLADDRDDELGACASGFNRVVTRVAALAEGSQKLASHLMALPLPVVELDAQRRIIFANRAAQGETASGGVEGRSWAEVFDPPDKGSEAVQVALHTRVATTREERLRGSGRVVHAQVTALPVASTGGLLVSWSNLEGIYGVVGDVHVTTQRLGNASESLKVTSERISDTAQALLARAHSATEESESLNGHLGDAARAVRSMSDQASALATAMRDLDASLAMVAQNTAETAQVARAVDERSRDASSSMQSLQDALTGIGKVAEMIDDIADRVSLLALNAKIEAASAGDAGAGFGVVADEVKALAAQTSAATEEIKGRIDELRARSGAAMDETANIRGSADSLRRLSEHVAAAVEEQSAALSEMSRGMRASAEAVSALSHQVESASQAARNLSQAAHGVDASARTSADSASETQDGAQLLATMAQELRQVVGRFHLQ
jgi:methyl-accepting chemotaxis protein